MPRTSFEGSVQPPLAPAEICAFHIADGLGDGDVARPAHVLAVRDPATGVPLCALCWVHRTVAVLTVVGLIVQVCCTISLKYHICSPKVWFQVFRFNTERTLPGVSPEGCTNLSMNERTVMRWLFERS